MAIAAESTANKFAHHSARETVPRKSEADSGPEFSANHLCQEGIRLLSEDGSDTEVPGKTDESSYNNAAAAQGDKATLWHDESEHIDLAKSDTVARVATATESATKVAHRST